MLHYSSLRTLVFILLIFPGACASVDTFVGNDPIVDTKGLDLALYDTDLLECKDYADQVNVAGKVATGTVAGAVVGGAVGSVWGGSRDVKRGAEAGAVTGAVGGVGSGLNERKRVVRNCLSGRGYLVLN